MKNSFLIFITCLGFFAGCKSPTNEDIATEYCVKIIAAEMNKDRDAAEEARNAYEEWLGELTKREQKDIERTFKKGYAEAIAKGCEPELTALAEAILDEDKLAIRSALSDFDKKVGRLDEDIQKNKKKVVSNFMKDALKDKVNSYVSKVAEGLANQDRSAIQSAQKEYTRWLMILPEDMECVMDPIYAECIKAASRDVIIKLIDPIVEAYRYYDVDKAKEAMKNYKSFKRIIPESAESAMSSAINDIFNERFDPICDLMISDFQKNYPTNINETQKYVKEYSNRGRKILHVLDDDIQEIISNKVEAKMREVQKKTMEALENVVNNRSITME